MTTKADLSMYDLCSWQFSQPCRVSMYLVVPGWVNSSMMHNCVLFGPDMHMDAWLPMHRDWEACILHG